ncbi:DUF3857 domain-containing protein [Aureivirga sp. CE67]|uniref:DUF3857 domain-containing protein n=1 Tax=Aureivirga sp. CE67 TaxID=1788983 RepID=UPI0018C99770|nr:DUF3857 domain-containing protein [Aureivirga sp. CE67]
MILNLSGNKSFAQNKIDQKIQFTKTPSWVKKYPKPKKQEYDGSFSLMQREIQNNHILKEKYIKDLYHINSPRGFERFSYNNISFNQKKDSLLFCTISIHRKGKIIDLIEKVYIERYNNAKSLGEKKYEKTTDIEVHFDNLKFEDVIEVSYVLKNKDNTKTKPFYFEDVLQVENLRGTKYVLLIEDLGSIDYTVSNAKQKVKKYRKNGANVFEYKYSQKNVGDEVEQNSSDAKIYFYPRNNWNTIVLEELKKMELDTFPSKKVHEKVHELTKGLLSLESKITKVLDFTQKEISNLNSSYSNSNFADTALDLTYADDKSKAILTIKMLEVLGVKSWPVLIRTNEFKNEIEKITSTSVFDRKIIEYIFEKDTLIFDPFSFANYGKLRHRQFKDFNLGLRMLPNAIKFIQPKELIENELLLTAIYAPTEKSENFDEFGYFDDFNAFKYDINLKIKGPIANNLNSVYEKLDSKKIKKQYIEFLNEKYINIYGQLASKQIQFDFEMNSENGVINSNFKLKDTSKVNFRTGHELLEEIEGDRRTSQFSNPMKIFNVYDKENLWKSYNESKFKKREAFFKIKKADWMNIFKPDTLIIENDWIKYHKKTWESQDTIYASYAAEFLKPTMIEENNDEMVEVYDKIQKANSIDLRYEFDYSERKGFWFYNRFLPYLGLTSLVVLFFVPWVLFIRARRKLKKLKKQKRI